MKRVRLLLLGAAALALTALASGCFVTSAQVFVHYALPDPVAFASGGPAVMRETVDLNTIEDYVDHKDKLKGLADVALLGTFANHAAEAAGVEVWITAATTTFTTASEVRDGAVKLWGPVGIPAGGSLQVDWARSAELFGAAGRQVLVDETKGDGRFTLYAIATSDTYDMSVSKGMVVLVLDAGI